MKSSIHIYVLFHVFHAAGAFHVSRSILRSPSLLFSGKESLPSTYDISLPAGLRGEAVRSALKSDRGVCFDFTSRSSSVKNVGVVKVSGKGTAEFLNNKLSNTYPSKLDEKIDRYGPNGLEVKIERGIAKEGGLLNSKGHIIDRLNLCTFPSSDGIGIEAYMMTSPGHAGSQLFNRLDPFIFPLDEVKLIDMCPTKIGQTSGRSQVFTFAATKVETAQNCIKESVLPIFDEWHLDSFFSFPTDSNDCVRYSLSKDDNVSVELLICKDVMLPSCVSRGYTVVISDKAQYDNDVGSQVWALATAESNFNGPVALGPLEYETLRIEGGQPGFNSEMTGHLKKSDEKDENSVKNTKSSPLELYLEHVVDSGKGCYQGQEGVASLLKNKRGLPRTLYSVVFPEEDNYYEGQKDEEEYSNHSNRIPNETEIPTAGEDFYVLGSNKTIKVGTLTSVAERGGTSMPETVALALVRRSDTILKKMQDLDLEINRDGALSEQAFDVRSYDGSSGIIMPPPLDPLDGLEIVLNNGMTRGLLRVTPWRKSKAGQNMFEIEEWATSDYEGQTDSGSVMGYVPDNDEEGVDIISAPDIDDDGEEDDDDSNDDELKAAIEAARIATDDARRKEEKMQLLQKRAEEAMAKRKAAKEVAQAKTETEDPADETPTESDADRKAARMEMLKKKAEEAMARRKSKKE